MQLLERLGNLMLVQLSRLSRMYGVLSVWFIFTLLGAVKAQPFTAAAAAAVCELCPAHVLCAAAVTAPE